MDTNFTERINVIREMLESPSVVVTQEGFDDLMALIEENSGNQDLSDEIIQIAAENPNLGRQILERLKKFERKTPEVDGIIRELNQMFDEISSRASPPDNATPSKREFLWWYVAIYAFVLISAWTVIILLPDTNTLQRIVVALVALSAMVMLPYILPTKDRTVPIGLSGIKLNYTTHAYVSVGDQNTIDVSIENTGNNEFNGSITLIFQDPDSSVKPAPNESLSVKIEVPPHGRVNRQFKFILAKKPLDGGLNYCFRIASSDGPQHTSGDEVYSITPVPYLRSIGSWVIGGSGIIALIIAFLWQLIIGTK